MDKRVLVYVIAFLSAVHCSHFRGGFITWRPTVDVNKIEIIYSLAWKRSYGPETFCDQTTIQNRRVLNIDANFFCVIGCSGKISTLPVHCQEFSVFEDWIQGVNSFTYKLPISGSFYQFQLNDCCWLNLKNGAGSAEIYMMMTASTVKRVDTGRVNTAPLSSFPPILRLLSGCNYRIDIPILDADDDIVRCRLPKYRNESGYLSNSLQNSVLEVDCTFSYSAIYGNGMYGFHVQIEDFISAQSSSPLSSVPLQFLIDVYDDPISCDNLPTFVDPTPKHGICFIANSDFQLSVVARANSPTHSISDIILQAPLGMRKSNLQPYGSTGREWHVKVKWSPTSSQRGYHLVCFSALANNRFSSSPSCIKLLVGDPPRLELVSKSLFPAGKVITTQNILRIAFNKRFIRPLSSKYIKIYTSDGRLAQRIDVTDPSIATYPINNQAPYFLTIRIPSALSDGIKYYVLVDEDRPPREKDYVKGFLETNARRQYLDFCSMVGLTLLSSSSNEIPSWHFNMSMQLFDFGFGIANADGKECLRQSSAILDPLVWTFSIRDTTPPRLTFDKNNVLNVNQNETIIVRWSMSEPVASVDCTMTTPRGSSKTSCRTQWTGSYTETGSYTISVVLTDMVGNVGGPFMQSFRIGDNVPPRLKFAPNSILDTSQNGTIIIRWEVNEPVARVECIITTPSDTESMSCDTQWTGSYSKAGNYSISVSPTDVNGNVGGPFTQHFYIRDTTPPSLAFQQGIINEAQGANVAITWVLSEPINAAECTLKTPSRNVKRPCDTKWSGTYTEIGNYELVVFVTDKAGNVGGPFRKVFRINDATPPRLEFLQSKVDVAQNETVSLSWTVSEPVVTVDCVLKMPRGTQRRLNCNRQWSGKLTEAGNYVLAVYLTDGTGNVGGPFIQTFRIRDVIPPALVFAPENVLIGIQNATIALRWTVSEPVKTAVCTITTPGGATESRQCNTEWIGRYADAGQYSFAVLLTDLAGNIGGPFSETFHIRDIMPPQLDFTQTITEIPQNSVFTIGWTINEPIKTISCTIMTPKGNEIKSCTTQWTGSYSEQGNYAISIILTDNAGNIGGPFRQNFRIRDVIPPRLEFTQKHIKAAQNETITIGWVVSEPVSSTECTIGTPRGHERRPCGSQWTGNYSEAGNYVLSVTLADIAGNIGGPFKQNFLIQDVTPPTLRFRQSPVKSYSNVTIIWTVNEVVSSSLCVIRTPLTTLSDPRCNGFWSGYYLTPGKHVIEITLTDTSGNIGGPYRHQWENVDITPPALTFIEKPTVSYSNVTVTWKVSELVTTVCEIITPTREYSEVCNGTWTGTNLLPGNYSMTITVYDDSLNFAGRWWHSWVNEDIQPPVLTFILTPNITYGTATVTWSVDEPATSICEIQTVQRTLIEPCNGSWTGKTIPSGNVSIAINVTDAFSNSKIYYHKWYNGDDIPPVLIFRQHPSTSRNNITITWDTSEPAISQCTITYRSDSRNEPCYKSWTGTFMEQGNHSITITLTDNSGNIGGPYSHLWFNVDTAPPILSFEQYPLITRNNATITWTVNEELRSSECTIRSPTRTSVEECQGSWRGFDLENGVYIIEIILYDTSGNRGGPYQHRWLNGDFSPPILQFTQSPATSNGSIIVRWTTNEPVTSVCSIYTPVTQQNVSCKDEWRGTNLRGGNYSIHIHMVDVVGNVGETAIHNWRVVVKEVIYRIVLTLANIILTDFSDKSSVYYADARNMTYNSLYNFYQARFTNLKELFIRDVRKGTLPNQRYKRRSGQATYASEHSLVVDHDVILNEESPHEAHSALASTLSGLFSDTSLFFDNIPVTASTATILMDESTQVTFSNDVRPCDIFSVYVTCAPNHACVDSSGKVQCRTKNTEDKSSLIISIVVGVLVGICLIVIAAIMTFLFIRKSGPAEKQSLIKKKDRYRKAVVALPSIPVRKNYKC